MIKRITLRNPLPGILDMLLPPRCLLCGGPAGSTCLCAACKSDLPWAGFQCHRCGLPLTLQSDKICGACITRPPPFTATVSPLNYRFPADRLVQAFKFRRQHAAGRILADIMAENIPAEPRCRPDMLIPVPLHLARFAQRGFNQAYELANRVGAIHGIQVNAESLRRKRRTRAQSGLSRKQRKSNVSGAFDWAGHRKAGRHVALVDDVMTTGTTVVECTRVLLKAGAKRVDVWVAARAVPGTTN